MNEDVARAISVAPRWRPAPAVSAAMAAHVGGVALLAAEPAYWPWVLGTLAFNHGAFSVATVSPRSTLIGANLSRLPAAAQARNEIAVTFDDGPDPESTPEVLDALDQYGIRATFFCVGERVERHPGLAREILSRGHTVENHTHRHPETFGFYGYRRSLEELGRAQAAITAATGRAPRFFRAPFGIRNPFLDPAAQRLGLAYVSWTRRGLDTIDDDVARVAGRLTGRLAAGDILTLHDAVATRRGRIRRPPMRAVLARLAEAATRAKLRPVPLADAIS